MMLCNKEKKKKRNAVDTNSVVKGKKHVSEYKHTLNLEGTSFCAIGESHIRRIQRLKKCPPQKDKSQVQIHKDPDDGQTTFTSIHCPSQHFFIRLHQSDGIFNAFFPVHGNFFEQAIHDPNRGSKEALFKHTKCIH